MRRRVLAAQVVRVVGGDQRQSGLARQIDQPAVHRRLVGNSVVLQFEKEVAGEDLAIERRRGARLVVALVAQQPVHLAVQAGGEADQPLGVRGEELLVDARLVVEPLEERLAGELQQVQPAGRGPAPEESRW